MTLSVWSIRHKILYIYIYTCTYKKSICYQSPFALTAQSFFCCFMVGSVSVCLFQWNSRCTVPGGRPCQLYVQIFVIHDIWKGTIWNIMLYYIKHCIHVCITIYIIWVILLINLTLQSLPNLRMFRRCIYQPDMTVKTDNDALTDFIPVPRKDAVLNSTFTA